LMVGHGDEVKWKERKEGRQLTWSLDELAGRKPPESDGCPLPALSTRSKSSWKSSLLLCHFSLSSRR
jgi:hypothetical protein